MLSLISKSMRVCAISAAMLVSAFAVGGEIDALKRDFENPPAPSRAETWYHFTTNAATKEGITADIEAMRDIGFTTAHVFAIGSYGKIPGFELKFDSEQWRGLMRHLGKEAKRCGIALGTHNCPGWSSSGGPWIKPEDSMKMVVASETFATAPLESPVKLPQPESKFGFYRDIAVIAIPSGGRLPTPASADADMRKVLSGRVIALPMKERGSSADYVLEFPKPVKAQTAKLVFKDLHVYVGVDISVSADGKIYRKIVSEKIASFADSSAPHYFSLKDAGDFKFCKVSFRNVGFPDWFSPRDMHLKSIEFLADPMIFEAPRKVSMGKAFTYWVPNGNEAAGADKSKVLVLTDKFKNGVLSAGLPAGDWKILRIGYTSTGAKNQPTTCFGLECDKLSKRGLDAHWPHYMAKMIEDCGGMLKNATIDSYEVSGQNWTENFAEEFRVRRGYDIVPWLPVMVGCPVGTPEECAKFSFDVQTTVAELFAENYFDYFGELCRKNGLISIAESYGGPFDYLRGIRHIEFPATEFWVSPRAPSRAVLSMANVYGKSRAGAESFTTMFNEGRWQNDPRDLKFYGDRAWSRGVSEFIMHSYVHQPFNAGPGLGLGRHGSHLNRLNTWWKMGGEWVKYIGRSQVLLQRGVLAGDVLVMPPLNSPNSMFYGDSVSGKLFSAGYSAAICSPFDLGEILFVENGRVKAAKNGASFGMLAIPGSKYMSVKKLRALRRLVADGATVAAAKPRETPTLSDSQADFDALVAEIWGNGEPLRRIGRGRLIATGDIFKAISTVGMKPDFKGRNIDFLKRIDGGVEIFYLYNTAPDAVSQTVSFRVEDGKVPQIWNAENGSVENAARWSRRGEYVEMPLDFAANEPKFVVFADGKAAAVSEFTVSGTAKKPASVKILEAKYGSGNSVVDVLGKVAAEIGSGITVSNETFGKDPAPMKPKKLCVRYSKDGEIFEREYPEKSVALISVAPQSSVRPLYRNGVLSVEFRENAKAEGSLSDGSKFSVSVSDIPAPRDISENWKVEFQKNRGAPDSIALGKLQSLSESEIDGIKYFSGEMLYSKNVEIPAEFFKKNRRIILSFGGVYNVAEVWLNGKKATTLWTPPFECDITDFAKSGANSLSVKVANLWVNRIIGDQREPDEGWQKWALEGKSVSETKRFTFSNWTNSWAKDSPLKKSGLTDGASVSARDYVPLK